MSFVQINSRKAEAQQSFPLFELGFRPFFLGASLLAIISISLWMLVYFGIVPLELRYISSSQWHSHEMIYGYSMAVIAGFLLTAIVDWTGVQTARGLPLLFLFLLWLVPRVLLVFGSRFMLLASVVDLAFMVLLSVFVARPIVAVKQWRQLGVLSKLLLLMLGNLCFYLGCFGILENGAYWGVYGGLYLVIALILTIGNRVVPAFIVNGVGYDVEIRNPKVIAWFSLVLLPLFLLNQLFFKNVTLAIVLPLGLFVLTSLRLILWHTVGIWRKPLLWSLYTSFLFIDLGFLLLALNSLWNWSPYLAVHAFGFGGIGLVTFSMMSRVALGHTGRNIHDTSSWLGYALVGLGIGAGVRVLGPVLAPQHYSLILLLAQTLWTLSFGIFFALNSKILVRSNAV